MPSQSSAKLSKYGRLANAHKHHIITPGYNTAKRISGCVVHYARHEADKVVCEGIDHKSFDIFHLANQTRKENVDVVGDKPVKNDAGEMSMSEEAMQNAWAEH